MKIKKILSVMIILSMTIFIVGCGGDEDANSFPTEPIEIVSMGITDSLNSFKEETKDSVMNLNSYIGLSQDELDKPHVQINLDLETEDGTATLYYKSMQNDAKDKASLTLGVIADGQEAQTSVNFTGNDMIMSFFTVEEPMVKYTGVDSSLKSLSPMDRYVKALELGDSKMFSDSWSDDVSKLQTNMNTNLTSDSVILSKETIKYHDVDVEADLYSVEIDESYGGTLLADLFKALSNNEDVYSYLTAMENSDGLLTLKSLENVVNDENKLSQTTVTANVYLQEETFLACNLSFDTPDGKFIMENNYYTKDIDRHVISKVVFPSGVTLNNTHTVYASDTGRQDNLNFEMTVKGSDEPLKIVSENKITENGDNYSKEFKITYSGVAEGDGIVSSLGESKGKYEAVTSGDNANGTFSGTYTSKDPEEGVQNTDYSGTTVLSSTAPEITLPEFIEGSGVEFSNVDKLKAYLNQDGDSPTKGVDNLYEQQATALMWMLRFNL